MATFLKILKELNTRYPRVSANLVQIKRFGKRREIVSVCIHVISIPGLARSAVTAPVMCDAAVPTGSQKEHLVLKCVCAERPSVAENNRLSVAPVVVVNLRTISGCNETHQSTSFGLSPQSTPSAQSETKILSDLCVLCGEFIYASDF
jgi:hypothetical protein